MVKAFCGCLALLFSISCAVDLDESVLPCSPGTIIESAHKWGHTVALRPAPGHEWSEVLVGELRDFGSPPVDIGQLQARYGKPTRTWDVQGRPFIEYSNAAGNLQLGLEEDTSGSATHRSWRLRWRPQDLRTSQALDRSALQCVSTLLPKNGDLLVLSRQSGLPKISIELKGTAAVSEIVWLNLEKP